MRSCFSGQRSLRGFPSACSCSSGFPTAFSEQRGFVPYDHGYLNCEIAKLSKSRGTAVEVPCLVSKYDPDPLHVCLTTTAPETRDTELALRTPKGHPGSISWGGTPHGLNSSEGMSRAAALHRLGCTILSARLGLGPPNQTSSSSNAFASLRSTVSNVV